MRIFTTSILALALAGACADDKKQPTAPPAPEEEPAATPVEPEPAEAAGEPAEPAEEPAEASDCVQECIDRSQMRSVSPEQIEEDCRAECGESE